MEIDHGWVGVGERMEPCENHGRKEGIKTGLIMPTVERT
jgi:hypothetical protein